MTFTVSIGTDYHEISTERHYDRSAAVFAQIGTFIPTMEEVQKEFRHALPSNIEMTTGPTARFIELVIGGVEMQYRREHGYLKVVIENGGMFSNRSSPPHPRLHDHIRAAYFAAARKFAGWIAERAAPIGPRAVLHVVGGTILHDGRNFEGDIPRVGVCHDYDAMYALLASYFFLTPVLSS